MSDGVRRRPSARRCASPTPTGSSAPRSTRSAASPRWPPCPARPTTAGHWRSTSAAASTSPARRSGRWMTANAGRFGFVHPDWARPARREARALALGVRLHLLSRQLGRSGTRRSPEPGQVGQPRARAGSRSASRGLPGEARGDARPGAGDRPVRGDDDVHVRHGQAGRGDPLDHPLAGRPGRTSPAAAPSGATTAPPAPRRAGRGRRPARGRSPPTARGARRRRRRSAADVQGSGDARPGGRRPASPPRSRPASGQSRTAIPAVAAAASVTGRCATQEASAAAIAGGGRRHAGAGHLSARSLRCTRTMRSSSSRTTTEPAPGPLHEIEPQVAWWPAWAAPGRRPRAGRRRRPASAAAAGAARRTSRRSACPSLAGAPRRAARAAPSGRAGRASRLARSADAQPHRQHVVVPAGGAAHPGGRRRPDGVAGGGDVQLGQRRPRGGSRRPGARASSHSAPRTTGGERARGRSPPSQCGTRASGPALAGGQRAHPGVPRAHRVRDSVR